MTYVHTDHLNTPRTIARPSDNAMLWRWDSDPFGTTAANEDPDGDLVPLRYYPRFPGQFYDASSEMHYNHFRDYDPANGRYLESDPIGINGGLNTYGYAMQNPIRWYDEAGLASTLTEVACGRVGIPTQAQRCVDQAECFERGQNGLNRCQTMSNAFRKFLCIRCWEAYTSTCPGKEKGPHCDRQACLPFETTDRRAAL